MIRHIWILIAKKLNGEASEEELRQLEKFTEYSEDESVIEVMEQIWNISATTEDDTLDQRWAKFQTLIQTTETEKITSENITPLDRSWTKKMLQYVGYAAAIILTIGLVYLLAIPAKTEQSITAMTAPENGVSKLILPDGSSVWLNAGSKITYKKNNETQCREVSLSGEAYFDVVKDARHPFTVSTSSFKIRVLGTAFNVRSYESGKTAEATLVRGRIELSILKSPETKYILKPDDKFTMNKLSPRSGTKDSKTGNNAINSDQDFSSVELKNIQEHPVEGLPSEVLWIKNVIDFDNVPFEEIAKMMEHKYNVNILFENDKVKKIKFSGKFKNETLEEAMKELQQIIDFKYKTEKDLVTIF